MPRLPQRMGAPYLGQQYIAAALLAAGHEVRVLDAAAPAFDLDITAVADDYRPDVIGMTLFTSSAARGYDLARKLRGRGRLLLAGGPHPTVCPLEPLSHGFDATISGEGERAVVALVAALEAGEPLEALAGVHTAQGSGPAWSTLDDLDDLPRPFESYPLFDPAWYGTESIVAGGVLTSRGCPARCSFCANYVTGRSYRWRSEGDVVAELVALRSRFGVRHFPFWDDAFTARRPRLEALCEAILAEPALAGTTWTCITPGNMVKPRDLERMRRAGCLAVNFGIESGDLDVLRMIQKGQRPEQVVAAVRAASDAGLTTIVNFMFGFPGESVDQLMRTRELMERLAPHTTYFNNRGVLVPFPGTAIYDQHRAAYDLEGWWLDPANVPIEPDLHALSPEDALVALEHDPTLDLDFFRYSDDVRDAIAECVAFKARHNYARIRRLMADASSLTSR